MNINEAGRHYQIFSIYYRVVVKCRIRGTYTRYLSVIVYHHICYVVNVVCRIYNSSAFYQFHFALRMHKL